MKNVVIFGNEIYSVSGTDISNLIKLREKYKYSYGDKDLWNQLCNLEETVKRRSKFLGKAIYKA